jgi:hypothetical protein
MSKEYLKLLLMLCIINTFNLFAQQDNRKFNISLCCGAAPIGLGPASGMENAMKSQGYDEESYFFGGRVTYPHSYSGSLSWMIQGQYLLNKTFSLSLTAGEVDLGNTIGSKPENSAFLHIYYSIFAICPAVMVNLGNIFQIGAGPAFFNAKANNETHFRLGLVFEAGFNYPADSRYFFRFLYQFRYVGKIDIGAQRQDFSDQYSAPIGEILYDHTFIGTGVGVRI